MKRFLTVFLGIAVAGCMFTPAFANQDDYREMVMAPALDIYAEVDALKEDYAYVYFAGEGNPNTQGSISNGERVHIVGLQYEQSRHRSFAVIEYGVGQGRVEDNDLRVLEDTNNIDAVGFVLSVDAERGSKVFGETSWEGEPVAYLPAGSMVKISDIYLTPDYGESFFYVIYNGEKSGWIETARLVKPNIYFKFYNETGDILFGSHSEIIDVTYYDVNQYGFINKLDENSNVVWSRQTRPFKGKDACWSGFGIYEDQFYYNDWNNVYCLDVNTGEDRWMNDDMQELVHSDAGYADYVIGEQGELYITDAVSDGLLVIDKDGNTVFFSGRNDTTFFSGQITDISYESEDLAVVQITDRSGKVKTYNVSLYGAIELEPQPYGQNMNNSANSQETAKQSQSGYDGTVQFIGKAAGYFNNGNNSNAGAPAANTGSAPSGSSTLYSSSDLNIRSNPAHDSGLVTSISAGTPMYYNGVSSQGYGSDGLLHDWYQITLSGGATGWIRADLVYEGGNQSSFSSGTVFYPINGELNLRAECSHNSGLVTTVYAGTPLHFTGSIGQGYGSDGYIHDWYYITLDNGVSGWVRSDMVYGGGNQSAVSGTVFYPVNGELNLRAECRHDSGLVTTVYGNTPLHFTGSTGQGYGSDGVLHNWYHVTLDNGVSGWVRSDMVW